MKRVLTAIILAMALAGSCSPAMANGYSHSHLNDQIDWVISEIDRGNTGMHYLAGEYSRAAEQMGGFSQWKIDKLKQYLENVRPPKPKVERWRR